MFRFLSDVVFNTIWIKKNMLKTSQIDYLKKEISAMVYVALKLI